MARYGMVAAPCCSVHSVCSQPLQFHVTRSHTLADMSPGPTHLQTFDCRDYEIDSLVGTSASYLYIDKCVQPRTRCLRGGFEAAHTILL